MSNRYKGGIISATPPTTTGGESGTASGAWTLEQQMQAQAAGLWPIQPPPPFIEDVFSTYLYTGNSSTQTITNGINLSANGGLVWVKGRNETFYHRLASSPGPTLPNYLASNATDAASSGNGTISAFTTTGFSVSAGGGGTNSSGINYCSWTFRKQPKFFDVVTYTGNGSTGGQTINHNLGSTPGCIIVKHSSGTNAWRVYHQSLGVSAYLALNTTAASATDANNPWKTPTSTTFGVGDGVYWSSLNQSGQTYVAYLFAHDAGGFGLTGTDNVISCGSYTGTGVALNVSLGYEPQWILGKRATNGTGDWRLFDNMRGMPVSGNSAWLYPNLSSAEDAVAPQINPTATGFTVTATGSDLNDAGSTYIYIAIRRGPMKVPTDATKVFIPFAGNGVVDTGQTVTTNFPVDLSVDAAVTPSTNYGPSWVDRLRGASTSSTLSLNSSSTNADNQQAPDYYIKMDSNTSIFNKSYANLGKFINWAFRRAPSFMDVVCYTGADAGTSFSHNLGVIPELIIFKSRSNAAGWITFINNSNYLFLNTTAAQATATNFLTRTSTSVTTGGTSEPVNYAGYTYVAYLFATCAGVSKVGTYTGTGATLTVDCGFTGGARFVIIKRTDSTSSWFVWDTARGMVAGTDPRLTLNTTDAQVNSNQVYTVTTGFQVVTADLSLNAIGGTYLFLAIA